MTQIKDLYRPLATVLTLAVSSVTASAETITVCADGCDYTSINAAIGAASDGDVIQLAAETYYEGEQIDTLGRAITLRGVLDKAGEPASVLDGAGAHRVLICQNGETSTTVFRDLVIQHGLASGDSPGENVGGGMYNASGSSPNLTNCTFASNFAIAGGGMCNGQSSPTLVNCTFTNNAGYDNVGGGMANYDSSPTLTDCTFASNYTTTWAWSGWLPGGGMYNSSSSPTLTDCTFASNYTLPGWFGSGPGGGMANLDSSPTLTNCTFTNNSAGGAPDSGGGMYNSTSSPTLTDCTFAGNSASSGGGMFNSSSSPTLTDCNFCGNTSGTGNRNVAGDAIDGSSSGNLLLLNCNEGDVNFDLAIDAGDLGYLLSRWSASSVLNADINRDGEVNGADLGLILDHFGGATDATWAP